MKKIYLFVLFVLFGSFTFGQTVINYDMAVVFVEPASKSTKEVASLSDSLAIDVQLQNLGTTPIPSGDTMWVSYGKLNGTPYHFNGTAGSIAGFILSQDLAPNTAAVIARNVSIAPFAFGDTIEVYFWGLNGEGEDYDDGTRVETNTTNNQDWFILKESTGNGGGGGSNATCTIAGSTEVCKDSVITLTGTPAGGIFTVSSGTSNVNLNQNTGAVTGLLAGDAIITYSHTTCANPSDPHKIEVKTCSAPPTNSIDDFTASTVRVFPNPTTGTLHIQSSEGFKSVSILSLDGKTILTTTETTLDVSDLTNGIYLYQVITADGQSVVNRFVKQ